MVVIEGLGGVVRFRISDIDNLIHKSSLEASSATFTLYSSSGNYDMTLEVFTYTPYSDSRVPAHRRCCRGRPQHIYIPAHSTSRSRNFSTLQTSTATNITHTSQHSARDKTNCKAIKNTQLLPRMARISVPPTTCRKHTRTRRFRMVFIGTREAKLIWGEEIGSS